MLTAATIEPPARSPNDPGPSELQGRYLLIVVTDGALAEEVGAELGQRHAVLVATSLREAHAFIDAHDANIDAVVSAALLPSGRALFQHPKTLWARVPWAARVILSADDGRAVDPLGAVVVRRPHLPGDVARAVLRAIREPLPPLGDD